MLANSYYDIYAKCKKPAAYEIDLLHNYNNEIMNYWKENNHNILGHVRLQKLKCNYFVYAENQ